MAKRKVKKNVKKFFVGIIIIGLIALGISLFLKTDSGTKVKEKIKSVVTTTTTTTKPIVKIINEESNSRNIAVMINNISTVWGYQAGVQDAYMVYELLVEGGITRLMAVYKDPGDITQIGTIRSARHYYLDYVLENDAIFVHIGGSPQALLDIKSLKINEIVEGSATYRVKNGLSSEHTAFTTINEAKVKTKDGEKNVSGLLKAIENKKYRMTTETPNLLKYSVESVDLSKMEGAVVANTVSIPFGNSNENARRFEYDSEKKVYNRFQGKKAHTDYVTKEQYTAKNIITYKASYGDIKNDAKGRQEMDNIGSGKGYYISEGYAVPITWSKSSRSAQTVYKFMDGTPLIVNDGNTYIEIQPSTQNVTIS